MTRYLKPWYDWRTSATRPRLTLVDWRGVYGSRVDASPDRAIPHTEGAQGDTHE